MLKKNILCLVMAAVMTFGTVTTAKAEEITSSKDWTVDFKNDKPEEQPPWDLCL